ncbi:hypothetical protein SSP24_64020 [Streptomyces spinoverrucosus]|uniref:Uncharacterized protein n=1 Tax=Streptomyces spinoverrucosus TaxID=284043 RepID=A0A4Y3VPF3_9ACTN|nr:hypothetical protein [Streptomyces spinoverrucosus]GEC08747.1 hypothetical protein SSP24_64020 [Streptomyces spinoverrucosus]GHB64104.1 hypothetical protein GCM10010397_37790 [Streptomyces spinoverrucosus]
MSRSVGAHTADPCPRCLVEQVRLGGLVSVAGRDAVGYFCALCGNSWSRPVEDDLEVYDTVRADLPDRTLYGTVRQVDDDRVQVRDTSGGRLLWVARWRIILY